MNTPWTSLLTGHQCPSDIPCSGKGESSMWLMSGIPAPGKLRPVSGLGGLHSEFRNKLGEKRGEEKPRGNGGCFWSLWIVTGERCSTPVKSGHLSWLWHRAQTRDPSTDRMIMSSRPAWPTERDHISKALVFESSQVPEIILAMNTSQLLTHVPEICDFAWEEGVMVLQVLQGSSVTIVLTWSGDTLIEHRRLQGSKAMEICSSQFRDLGGSW